MSGIVKSPGRQPVPRGSSALGDVALVSVAGVAVVGGIVLLLSAGAALWIIPAYMLTFSLSLMGVPVALGFSGHCGLAMVLFLAKYIFSGGGGK